MLPIFRSGAARFLLLVALSGSRSSAFAQTPSSQTRSSVAKVELDSLQLLTPDKASAQISARDANEKAVYGLTARDFAVRQNDVSGNTANVQSSGQTPAVSAVEAVAGGNETLAVALCIDTSGSMKTRMSSARQAANRVLDSLQKSDAVALIEFDVTPRVRLHFTSEKSVARSLVNRLQSGRGNTALLDALDEGRALFSQVRTPRRALILISDGGDNASSLRAQEVAQLAKHGDLPPIFVLAIQADLPASSSEGALKSLCAQSGGRWFSSRDVSFLNAALEHLRRDSYRVTFAAPLRGSGEHAIRIGALSLWKNSQSSTRLSPEVAQGGTSAFVFSEPLRLQSAPLLPPDVRPLWASVRLLGLVLGGVSLVALLWLATRKNVAKTPTCFLTCSATQRRYVVANGAVVGRGREADIQIDDTEISRRHARFSLDANAWTLQDLGSTNGVLINGQKVRNAVLKAGDLVQFGHSVFEFHGAPASDVKVVG